MSYKEIIYYMQIFVLICSVKKKDSYWDITVFGGKYKNWN